MESTPRAKLVLDVGHLLQMLDLPPGVRVRGVHTNFDPVAIHVLVEGDGLPLTPENAEAPLVSAHLDFHEVPGEDRLCRSPRIQWPTSGGA